MPRRSLVISVFLASPGDVQSERELVSRTIDEWNTKNGAHKGVVFDLIRWETNISAGMDTDGQEVVNKQLPDYDLLIAIFWKRIGTPTPRSISGSVEEYENALVRRGKGENVEIAAYFKSAPYIPARNDLDQLNSLYEFKDRLHSDGALSGEFSDDDSLRFQIDLLLDRVSRSFSENSSVIIEPAGPSVDGTPEPAPQSVEVVERGLLDIVESLQANTERSTDIITDLFGRLKSMTAVVNDSVERLNEVNTQDGFDLSRRKRLVDEVSEAMDDYSEFLENR